MTPDPWTQRRDASVLARLIVLLRSRATDISADPAAAAAAPPDSHTIDMAALGWMGPTALTESLSQSVVSGTSLAGAGGIATLLTRCVFWTTRDFFIF